MFFRAIPADAAASAGRYVLGLTIRSALRPLPFYGNGLGLPLCGRHPATSLSQKYKFV